MLASAYIVQPISQDKELEPLLQAIESAAEIYMDTEADSLHHYFEKICLLQFALSKDHHFLVDPLADLHLKPLFEVLSKKLLILHGADYDLRMLYANFRFVPAMIFDTMLAARLVGHSALGLEALVERYEGKHLDHGAQKADWSQRPLPPRLLKYAVEDTAYLPLITQNLRKELATLGRGEWHQQQCRQLIESCSTAPTKDLTEAWRIKGSSNLDRQSLAILRELWQWRDQEARTCDRPPFMVCHNEKLLQLTTWACEHPHGNIQHDPVLPKRWNPRRVQNLWAALQRVWALPESEWPLPLQRGKRPPYQPEFTLRLNRLRIARDQVAKNLHLEPSILAPNAILEMIASRIPKTLDDFKNMDRWLPWQTELLGPSFLQAMNHEPILC